MNLSLFSTKPSESGFRLHTYEVWNWGTFDNNIWSLKPEGETSLLTGGNGSGKTTLVDGLLTLLVPEKRMRFYNQTAGAKGERTEETYVVGEYGETENTDNRTGGVQKLRPSKRKAQSVLLAVFKNESQYVTLAQVRWFAGGELKRSFVIAHKQLSIAQDFSPLDNNGTWKKRLKQKYPRQATKEIIYLLDSPGQYGDLMRKYLGMRTKKAHTLFSQTIGLKILGNLDTFVRGQMLEDRDSEAEFQKIKTHFKTLSDAHKAIEKAHKQIELLSPVREKDVVLSKLKVDVIAQENHRQSSPFWFAQTGEKLIKENLITQTDEKEKTELKIDSLKDVIDELDQKRIAIEVQIQTDEVGRQIADLENQNKRLNIKKTERENELKNYNALAEKLDLQKNPQSLETFEAHRQKGLDQKKNAKVRLVENDNQLDAAKIEKHKGSEKFLAVSDELKALRSQQNNIPSNPARIRREITEHLGVTEKEIPFIGELIKVKTNEHEWESAIERLLHNYALRLIVPDEYYQQVNRYVNTNNLKGRIIYHKFNAKEISPAIFQQTDAQELIHKLAFKKSDYTNWIKEEISSKYNHVCTDDLELFRLSNKALTRKGFIKNGARHEKDDRPQLHNRQQYVLGWDNKEKIAALKKEANELDAQLRKIKERVKLLENTQKRIREEQNDLSRFADFRTFSKIDWWSLATEIQANKKSIEALEKTNDRVNVLKKQKDEMVADLKSKNNLLDTTKSQLSSIRSTINTYQQKLRECIAIIEDYEGLDIEQKLNAFQEAFLQGYTADLASIESKQKKIISDIGKSLDNLKEEVRKESSKAETLMRNFISPDDKTRNTYEDWNTDTHRLSENVEFIQDFVILLEKIEGEDLAKHKARFKHYLNEEMITKMSDFQAWLEQWEEKIERDVEGLNQSLNKIDFRKSSPATFIQLQVEKNYAPHVKEFKRQLQEWKPNLMEFERSKDDSILEKSFEKIKQLLDRLTAEENIRKEVLDVRNWLQFKAIEYYREEPAKDYRSYTGTAKLSGGEGAQLTYTILASAIAYQFGIHKEGLNTNSFRMICVDEAFSKQDDEKAHFLMELCKQLHLQVMVVSPAKAEDVAIVEPYIARVHFVQRIENCHSVVYDMTIKELQERREEYLKAQ